MLKSITESLEAGVSLVLILSHYNAYENYQDSDTVMQDFSILWLLSKYIHTSEYIPSPVKIL